MADLDTVTGRTVLWFLLWYAAKHCITGTGLLGRPVPLQPDQTPVVLTAANDPGATVGVIGQCRCTDKRRNRSWRGRACHAKLLPDHAGLDMHVQPTALDGPLKIRPRQTGGRWFCMANH